MNIGKFIQKERAGRKISTRKLGKLASVRPNKILDYEKSGGRIYFDQVEGMLDVLGYELIPIKKDLMNITKEETQES